MGLAMGDHREEARAFRQTLQRDFQKRQTAGREAAVPGTPSRRPVLEGSSHTCLLPEAGRRRAVCTRK